MKRSGTKAKYSPMEQANVYQVQFTTMSEDLIVLLILFSKTGLWLKSLSQSYTRVIGPLLAVPTFFIKGPNDLRLGVSSQDQKCLTCD